MLTLYHSPTTRSFRIKWLLEELGLPYEQKVYNFYNMERHDPEYRKINSVGSFPSIEDDGLVLTESGAIINYILRRYGNGRFTPAPGSREEAMVDEWMFWSEGLFAVHQRLFWDHVAPPPACIEEPIKSVGIEGMRQAIKYSVQVEDALRDDGYMVGDDLTAADFMLCFPLYLGNLANFFESRPKIRAYVERFSSRPAFKTALADTMAFLQKMATEKPEFQSFRATEALIDA